MKKGIILSIMFAVAILLSSSIYAEEVKLLTNAHCGSCKGKIEKAIKNDKAVKAAELNLDDKVVTVSFDANSTNSDNLIKAVSDAGYKATLVNEGVSEKSELEIPDHCKGMTDKAACKDMKDDKCCKSDVKSAKNDGCCKSKATKSTKANSSKKSASK